MNSNNSNWKQLLEYQTNTDKILFHGSEYILIIKSITKRC